MADDHDDDPVLTDRERELKQWNAPCAYQEYPRMLFRAATDPAGHIEVENCTVQSAGEEQEAQAAGWLRGPDKAVAAEKARQEAIAAARQDQEARKLAEMFSRVLDEREDRRKSELPPSQAGDQGAELTDISPKLVPPVSQQLRNQMEKLRLQNGDLVEATKFVPRTVERHVSGEREPRKRHTIKAYEDAISAALGQPFTFTLPPKPPRRRRNKRSQKAAKRR